MRGIFVGILLLPILLLHVAPAQADAVSFPVEIFEVMDRQRVVVFLRQKDISANPEWRPGAGEPPLSIGDAIEHVQRWITQDPRLKGAEIREIDLRPIHGYEQEHGWYYLLQLRPVEASKSKKFYTAVLLNGKVVTAIAEPSAIK